MAAHLKDDTSAAPHAPARHSPIWRMTFPGELDQPRLARRKLASLLREHPELGDILTVASELCTNAVVHTRSGHQDGTFTVQVTAVGDEFLMVAVTDEGAPTGPRLLTPDQTATNFRGLQLVKGLSRGYGVDGDAERRTVWALFSPLGKAVPGTDGYAGRTIMPGTP